MSRVLQRRQRPAPLQFLSIDEPSHNVDSTSSRQTRKASETASQSFGRSHSPVTVATTRVSSPKRSITTTSARRTKDAPATVFVTVTTTRRWLEGDEDKTPSPTRSVFFPAPAQTIRITISDAPTTTSAVFSTTTAGAGSSGVQGGTFKPELSPALSQTARVGLIVLGAICKSIPMVKRSIHPQKALKPPSWSRTAPHRCNCFIEAKTS